MWRIYFSGGKIGKYDIERIDIWIVIDRLKEAKKERKKERKKQTNKEKQRKKKKKERKKE